MSMAKHLVRFVIYYSILCWIGLTTVYAASSTVSALSEAEIKLLIDMVYPVGSLFVDSSNSTIPPGQDIQGIHWVEETAAQGSLLVGYSPIGDWAVLPGQSAGSSQTTQPHQLTSAELPAHSHAQGEVFERHYHFNLSNITMPDSEIYRDGKLEASRNFPLTSTVGGDQPHIHTLANLKRYGVKIWKRVE
mgnify:CR=1 FL=1